VSADPILQGQVIDTPTAQEFTRLAAERVGEHDLGDVAGLLERKSELFRSTLAPDRLPNLDEDGALQLLKTVFSSRRRAKVILNTLTLQGFVSAVHDLVNGIGTPQDRLADFHEIVSGIGRDVPASTGYDLGSELLHFSNPETHWLWTRWIWNPDSRTGALPLVVMEEVDLDGGDVRETYRRIGLAMAFLDDVGEAAGFRTAGHGVFGTDVFLASVYAVYMYTTLRMRMTQEFNRIIPELSELVQRLLGVNRLELPAEVGS